MSSSRAIVDPRSESKSSWLSALLAPVTADEFLSSYWRRQHLLCRGAADRFSALLSWSALNEILNHHWREASRFRVARQGHDLKPDLYADLTGPTPRIRARDVTDHLRRGATLSFDAIDEVHEPLTRLSESFEAFFRAGTQINIYAAFRALHGLDLHRDDQEVFILQLEGRKRWLLYGFSVDGVDRTELSRGSVPPAGALLDQILEPGDLLYIPRGCYHFAVPMNEPALHLTLGVKNPRTLESASTFKARPSFSLPWSATPGRLPPGDNFFVRLNARIRLLPSSDSTDGSIELRRGGHTYRFPSGIQWIIERLDDRAPLLFRRLLEAVDGRLDEEMARMLVGMLLMQGLATIHE